MTRNEKIQRDLWDIDTLQRRLTFLKKQFPSADSHSAYGSSFSDIAKVQREIDNAKQDFANKYLKF